MLSCECFPLFELGEERLYGFFLLPSGYIRGGKFKVFARRARTSKLPPLSSCSGGMMLLSTKHDPRRLSLLQPLRSCRFFRAQWSLRCQPAGSYIRCSRIGSGPNRGHGQPFRVCRQTPCGGGSCTLLCHFTRVLLSSLLALSPLFIFMVFFVHYTTPHSGTYISIEKI